MELFSYQVLESLHESELAVYRYLSAHPREAAGMNIRQLAAAAGVSTTTVLRLCKKAGCDGYRDLKFRLEKQLQPNAEQQEAATEYVIRFFQKAAVDGTLQTVLDQAAGWCRDAGQVLIAGFGPESGLALYGARLLLERGISAFPLTDPFYPQAGPPVQHGVLLALEGPNYGPELLALAVEYKKRCLRLVALVDADQSLLAKLADLTLASYMPGQNVTKLPTVFFLEEIARRTTR